MKPETIKLTEATNHNDYTIAVELFKEYAAYIGINLEFQNFDAEIKDLESQYARPKGVLCIAYNAKKEPIGCFGIRALEVPICELKRMYVKETTRGLGVGKKMMEKALELGRELGYKQMRLDTLDTMHTAISLYTKVGFYEIEPYCYNPLKGAKYFEVNLTKETSCKY